MTVLVTGATGRVGRHIVEQLLESGRPVRALTRDPDRADLPDGADVAAGDLTDPGTLTDALDGAEAMHLIAFGDDRYTPLATAPEVAARAARAGVRRFTVLTGTDAELVALRAVEATGAAWTHVRPTEFMANALFWAGTIGTDGSVRAPFGGPRHAMVHEGDVAAVAVSALLDASHAGRTYRPTGPEALSRADVVRAIGTALGRELRFVELTEAQGRAQLRDAGFTDDVVEAIVDYGRNPPAEATTVLPTVAQVTGRPPRTFARWAEEHADAFRALTSGRRA